MAKSKEATWFLPRAADGAASEGIRAVKNILATIGFGLATAAFTSPAVSAVTFIGTQAAFAAAGTITQNLNFDNHGETFVYPGDPYTVGAMTFVSTRNVIFGKVTYRWPRDLITDDFVKGTTVNISGSYDLFSFNAGNFFNQPNVGELTVTTNKNVYNFSRPVTYAGSGLTFLGFVASNGETISSVRFFTPGALGGTDFQLGVAHAVPEPTIWAMMLIGFGAIGWALRRLRGTYAVG